MAKAVCGLSLCLRHGKRRFDCSVFRTLGEMPLYFATGNGIFRRISIYASFIFQVGANALVGSRLLALNRWFKLLQISSCVSPSFHMFCSGIAWGHSSVLNWRGSCVGDASLCPGGSFSPVAGLPRHLARKIPSSILPMTLSLPK